jgi:hypothetical protein
MSLLTDFVIAPPGSGEEVGQSVNPADRWPTLQAKGVETIKLATLLCLVTNQAYSNDVQKSFRLVGGDKEEGPWVFEFPSEALQGFASIATSQLSSLASAWAGTDELRADGWSSADAEDCIAAISQQAKAALASSNSLYLWLAV